MRMKKLTLVVLNMNGLENLKVLFKSLKEQTFKDFDVIVSDNGSTDGSLEWLGKNRIKFVPNGKNLGFSGGNNVVLRKVRTEYVGVFNDDIRLEPNVLRTLVDFMDATPDAAAVQPKILSWDGRLVQSTGLVLTYGSFPAERDKWKSFVREVRRPEVVPATQGCCSIYRTSVFRKIGFFDEIYNPIYNEDFDVGLGLSKAGYKSYYHPVPVIYHRGGFTSKKMKHFVRLSFHRNRYRLLWKHGTARMWLETIAWTPVVAGFYLVRRPDTAYFQAMAEFLTGRICRGERKTR